MTTTIQTGRFRATLRGYRQTIGITYDAGMDNYIVRDASGFDLGTIDLVTRQVWATAYCDETDLVAIARGGITPLPGRTPRCRCCRRELTSPASIAAGIGPECAANEAARLAA